MSPRFLAVEEVLAIHADQIDRYGGALGVRDSGLLESAVMTVRQTFDGVYLYPSIAAMAAAYLYSLCMNHAFIDGNKRVGIASAYVFLKMNGYRVSGIGHDDLEALVLSVADGSVGRDELTEVFELLVRPI